MWAWCEGLYPVPAEADCLAQARRCRRVLEKSLQLRGASFSRVPWLQGCTGNEHHCHCETAAACTALGWTKVFCLFRFVPEIALILSGGKYVEHQCWQDLQWMAAEVHKARGLPDAPLVPSMSHCLAGHR